MLYFTLSSPIINIFDKANQVNLRQYFPTCRNTKTQKNFSPIVYCIKILIIFFFILLTSLQLDTQCLESNKDYVVVKHWRRKKHMFFFIHLL